MNLEINRFLVEDKMKELRKYAQEANLVGKRAKKNRVESLKGRRSIPFLRSREVG